MPKSRAEATNYHWCRYSETGKTIYLEVFSTFDPDGCFFGLEMFAPKPGSTKAVQNFATQRVGHAKVVCPEKDFALDIRVTATASLDGVLFHFETCRVLDTDGKLSAPTFQNTIYRYSSGGGIMEIQRLVLEPQEFSVSVFREGCSLFPRELIK